MTLMRQLNNLIEFCHLAESKRKVYDQYGREGLNGGAGGGGVPPNACPDINDLLAGFHAGRSRGGHHHHHYHVSYITLELLETSRSGFLES